MNKNIRVFLAMLCLVTLVGCAPLIIGGAVGVVGGYAISRDTIQGETDTDYQRLWDAALAVAKMRGMIVSQDETKGLLNSREGSTRVYIRLIKLTQATTRLKVSGRRYLFPNLTVAQEVFVKVIEEAKQ